MLEKNAKKGRLIQRPGQAPDPQAGARPGEDFDRFSTEIIVVPGHRVQFYDKPKGNDAPAAEAQPPMDETAAPTTGATDIEDPPF